MVFVPSGALCYALVHDPGRGGRWLIRSGLWSGGDPTAKQSCLAPRPGPVAGHAALTRLVKDLGTTRDLAGHLARLDDSAEQLYGKHLPQSLYDDLAACLAQRPSGRLRVTAQPSGGQLRVGVAVIPLAGHPETVRLHPAVILGGLGAHKRLDRRLIAELTRQRLRGPGEQLLIEDVGGEVLETDRASVFAVVNGSLQTPAADGRILPGVTRAAVLKVAQLNGIEVKTGAITRAQLAGASEVFVTNALRGVMPVQAIGDSPVACAPGGGADGLAPVAVAAAAIGPRTACAGSVPRSCGTGLVRRRTRLGVDGRLTGAGAGGGRRRPCWLAQAAAELARE
jgi:para-aminobenzoate synthetase / 4-amino-4-deoxychorismate lyase